MSDSETSIGPLMKAARKFKKFNQSDVATAIGCSQSALSKMEHNLLIPNAPQWFLFSRFTSIPPETIETGIIDRHSLVKLNNEDISLGFKLPKRYRLNRAQKVREIYPFLFFLEKKMDPEAFKQFKESVGIDAEFFLDFDNLVNFQLVVDLVNLFMRLGKASDEEIKEIVDFGQDDVYWDNYPVIWKNLQTPKELLIEYAAEQPYFQVDFHIHVEHSREALLASFIPEPHLYHFLKDLTPEMSQWLTVYRKYSLEHLFRKILKMETKVIPDSGQPTSPLMSRFEII